MAMVIIIVAIFGGFVTKKAMIIMSLPFSIDTPQNSLMDLNMNPKVKIIVTPLLEKCEDDIHTPKMGTLESFGTLETSESFGIPETSEFHCRGQNTLH